MTDVATTAEPPVEHTHAHHDSPHPTNLFYVRIAITLAVITGLEIAVSYMGMASVPEVAILLVLMAIKFVLVASNFMHLKFDNRLLTRVFYAGLALAVIVY